VNELKMGTEECYRDSNFNATGQAIDPKIKHLKPKENDKILQAASNGVCGVQLGEVQATTQRN
jgi:hypothetical protein